MPPPPLEIIAEQIRAARGKDAPPVDVEGLRRWLVVAGECALGPEDVERLRALAREPDPC